MAIWQFNIYFIPRQSLIDKYGQIPLKLEIDNENRDNYIQNLDLDNEPDFEDAMTIHWWLNINILLETLLPRLKQFGDIQPWTERTKGLRSFGDTETNDISVSFDNTTNQVQELSCRL